MTDDTPGNIPSTRRSSLGASYWRLWASSGLSNLADGIVRIALPLVAVQLTRSPSLIAGLTITLTLPWLLFALHAGALADRLDRRRVMLAANGTRITLLAGLALLTVLDAGSIWALYAVAFCLGTAETVYDTAAQSILPQIVHRDQLSRANGRLYAAELTANEFIGPPLAGFLTAVGVALAFTAPAIMWIFAVVALLLVRGSFRIERKGSTSLRADIAEGLRFLWHHRLLRTLAVMVGVFNFATNAVLAVFVLYAVGPTSPMGLSGPAFGLLLTAIAAGSLCGSLVAERIERLLGRARSLILAFVCGALLLGIPAATTHPLLIGAGFFIGGVGIVIWNVVTVSLRQRITPDRLLGRLNSGYRLVAWGTRPLGAAAGGLLASAFGLRAVFAIMAMLTFLLIASMRTVTNDRMDAAEREAGHA
ncbi:MFS transporter [Planomonospora parontospora]|uniref:MFS transporter n=1 Tax=Planomonospora parontospora TaxID=58119 RepID=UPI001670B369|nr:MFS transporter [Planomonospora parontospora]GGL38597.1 MFS transporter [Planomonospora parontospora subsp. antibiotica]GII17673.1 MFS transporter [Planomonospora parontospora subsp. antibiotica]